MLYKRYGLVVVIALLVTFNSLMPVMGVSLDEQLQQTQQEKDQLNGQISKYKDDEEILKNSINDSNKKITVAKASLDSTAKQLNSANSDVSKAENELKGAENRLLERINALQTRMRGVYENGQASLLELLFQSTSLSDFVNRMEYLNKILSNDQHLVQQISFEKDTIIAKKSELIAKRDAVALVKAKQDQDKAELLAQEGDLQAQLKKKQEMLDGLWQELKDNEAQEQKVRDLIRLSRTTNPAKRSHTGALVWPAPASNSISSKFGYRVHPVLGITRLHAGIDIPVPVGSSIVAAEDGVVISASELGGYGYCIIIDHGSGLQTLYGHLSGYAVSKGSKVVAGQTIAYSGGARGAPGSGTSTGPHLHFETRVNGVPEDPMPHL